MGLHSRRGHDWSKCLAILTDTLQAIRARSAILDAELRFPTADGAPSFYGLCACAAPELRGPQAIAACRAPATS
jgi:hypothetical protein